MAELDLLDPKVFLGNLRESGLLSEEGFARVSGFDLGERDARDLARFCMEKGLLTRFQAERILNGKTSGLILGQYRILEELGRGGMGRVYRAVHDRMERQVAIKVLSPQLMRSSRAQLLFDREVRAISRLSHPNIVSAYDANVASGRHFLVLELVEGPNLSRFLRKNGRLNVDQALEYTKQAAFGLAHAHKRGLVHRDIKPANLLISLEEKGGKMVPGPIKISDFGLARLRDQESGDPGESSIAAATQSVTGTPDYISPEQAYDVHQADIRSDIYSLGCTLYQCLTGKPPFEGNNVLEKLVRHASEAPPNPQASCPEIHERVALLVSRMMAKLPDQRFQTPDEVCAEIEQIQSTLSGDGSGQWVSAEAIVANHDYAYGEENSADGRSTPLSETSMGSNDPTLGPLVTSISGTRGVILPKAQSFKVGIAVSIGVGVFLLLIAIFWMFSPTINPSKIPEKSEKKSVVPK